MKTCKVKKEEEINKLKQEVQILKKQLKESEELEEFRRIRRIRRM